MAFAALALVVTGVGLFGSVRYDIAQRSREWAVRVALGADRPAIVGLIIRRSLIPILAGMLPGLLIAAALGRWIQPLLYRTSALDPLLFCLAATPDGCCRHSHQRVARPRRSARRLSQQTLGCGVVAA